MSGVARGAVRHYSHFYPCSRYSVYVGIFVCIFCIEYVYSSCIAVPPPVLFTNHIHSVPGHLDPTGANPEIYTSRTTLDLRCNTRSVGKRLASFVVCVSLSYFHFFFFFPPLNGVLPFLFPTFLQELISDKKALRAHFAIFPSFPFFSQPTFLSPTDHRFTRSAGIHSLPLKSLSFSS